MAISKFSVILIIPHVGSLDVIGVYGDIELQSFLRKRHIFFESSHLVDYVSLLAWAEMFCDFQHAEEGQFAIEVPSAAVAKVNMRDESVALDSEDPKQVADGLQ